MHWVCFFSKQLQTSCPKGRGTTEACSPMGLCTLSPVPTKVPLGCICWAEGSSATVHLEQFLKAGADCRVALLLMYVEAHTPLWERASSQAEEF